MLRKLRIALLLIVLATVAQSAWLARQRATDWQGTVQVALHPIVGDDSRASRDYVAGLDEAAFDAIEEFIREQGLRYGVQAVRPLQVTLGAPVGALPPDPPYGANPLAVAWWSLRLRYWAWRHTPDTSTRPEVRLYVIYHDPERSPRVPHSLGLEKGMLGVVHAFAARRQTEQNNVVIAHELLHTLGASDKYDPATSQPRHPEGYAEPDLSPRHPQRLAEIMGGRIPLSDQDAEIPAGLFEVVVGPHTAREIGWGR